MSSKTPPIGQNILVPGDDTKAPGSTEEWVEIVEPRTKKRIFANLESGICANSPPAGALVTRSDDFTDHWWELYDAKTGKYYYYNFEQQTTAWTRPQLSPSSNGVNGRGASDKKRRLLIIPVSRLQSFKKFTPQEPERCEVATQTMALKLVSTGTQTACNDELTNELGDKFDELSLKKSKANSPPSATLTDGGSSCLTNEAAKIPGKSNLGRRQMSDFNGRGGYLNSVQRQPSDDVQLHNVSGGKLQRQRPVSQVSSIVRQLDRSSQQTTGLATVRNYSSKRKDSLNSDNKQATNTEDSASSSKITPYFGPSTSIKSVDLDKKNTSPPAFLMRQDEAPRDTQSSSKNDSLIKISPSRQLNNGSKHLSSTTTFGPPPRPQPPVLSGLKLQKRQQLQQLQQHQQPQQTQQPKEQHQQQQKHQLQNSAKIHQQMTTNNLSHYLVREAREMGIALISDDDMDDEDVESDEDCVVDDDEDSSLRDDNSTHRDGKRSTDRHKPSQDLGDDSASEGWKSFSDQDSPNNTARSNKTEQPTKSHRSKPPPPPQRSPSQRKASAASEKSSSVFTPGQIVVDDLRDPAAGKSQQLDHRKLVENFKKSRQTSSFVLHDSLGRSYMQDAQQAMHRIKTVADGYFNHGLLNQGSQSDREATERQLRHLSTLSTLPRPLRDKSSAPSQRTPAGFAGENVSDADYDIVEENCSFYGDSKSHFQFNSSVDSHGDHSLISSNDSPNIAVGHKSSSNLEPNSPSSIHFERNKSTRGSTFSVESFARENITRHREKGGLLFNRKVKWSRMISWTKNSIRQPMISSVSSDLESDSISSFKLIQQYMGDRKVAMNKRYRQVVASANQLASGDELPGSLPPSTEVASNSKNPLKRSASINSTSSSVGGQQEPSAGSKTSSRQRSNIAPGIPDRLRDELAFEVVVKGCAKSALRDEIYMQMARQLTENPSQESVTWGLVLMSILLSFFSPSSKFAPFLASFLETHQHQMAQDVCLPRLEKRLNQNWPAYCRKPSDGSEISMLRLSITRWPQYCGVFGESLERIMALQQCSPYLKTLRLPWILTILAEKLLETGGAETEGIFRCAADQDLLAQLRLEIDCVDFRKIIDAKQLKSLLSNVQDPHVVAGLLKLFFRQLKEPVFSSYLYEACLQSGHDPQLSCQIFSERLSNLNKDVVAYLIHLLQSLSAPDKVTQTKMDSSNLSMVWAPNLLRLPQTNSSVGSELGGGSVSGSKWSIANGVSVAPSDENPASIGGDTTDQATATTAASCQLPTSQSMIFEQTRQEMQFVRALITHLDTNFIKDVA